MGISDRKPSSYQICEKYGLEKVGIPDQRLRKPKHDDATKAGLTSAKPNWDAPRAAATGRRRTAT